MSPVLATYARAHIARVQARQQLDEVLALTVRARAQFLEALDLEARALAAVQDVAVAALASGDA